MRVKVILVFNPNAPCYMTAEINRRVPNYIIQVVLDVLFELSRVRGNKMDYLQVFSVTPEGNRLTIQNHQEMPPEEQSVAIDNTLKLDESFTIWVIWENDHTIVLFPSDY